MPQTTPSSQISFMEKRLDELKSLKNNSSGDERKQFNKQFDELKILLKRKKRDLKNQPGKLVSMDTNETAQMQQRG